MGELIKNLESMDVILENCESFIIFPEYIECFYFKDFEKAITFQSPNNVFEYDRVKLVKLRLINIDKIKGNEIFQNEFKDRIHQYKDICYIRLNYIDETSFGFYVPWDFETSKQSNSWQQVNIENNIMEIEIRKPEI